MMGASAVVWNDFGAMVVFGCRSWDWDVDSRLRVAGVC
jgi:hypothetical protein